MLLYPQISSPSAQHRGKNPEFCKMINAIKKSTYKTLLSSYRLLQPQPRKSKRENGESNNSIKIGIASIFPHQSKETRIFQFLLTTTQSPNTHSVHLKIPQSLTEKLGRKVQKFLPKFNSVISRAFCCHMKLKLFPNSG